MFGARKNIPAEEPLGLKQQVAAWAARLPVAWPARLRTGLVVAAMLVLGTLAVCLAPVILFILVYTGTFLVHRH